MIHVELTPLPIRAADHRARLSHVEAGGLCVFEGVARAERNPEHSALAGLEYEAHPALAERQMRQLAESAMKRWKLHAVYLIHRLGFVPVGETSVIVGVAGGHRAESFEACRSLIDRLKAEVPIWKKEAFEDGSTRWARGTRLEST